MYGPPAPPPSGFSHALLNTHADMASSARGLLGGLRLHRFSYIAHASSKSSNETARIRRLIKAFAASRCDKYVYHCKYIF